MAAIVESYIPDTEVYNPNGTTPEMRAWIKQRDGYRCQFHEPKMVDGRLQFVQCPVKENPDKRGSGRFRLEVHHIYPQHKQKVNPTRYGGENPYNLILLCAGLHGSIGHHDLLQPTMIIAKQTYAFDRTSYERWIAYAHEAYDKGLSTYDPQYDFMLKSIARLRTDIWMRDHSDTPFPYRKRVIRD